MAVGRTQSVSLDLETTERLASLAAQLGSSVAALTSEAVKAYLEINEFQIQEIQAAIAEADGGQFASAEEVTATFAKWGVRGA